MDTMEGKESRLDTLLEFIDEFRVKYYGREPKLIVMSEDYYHKLFAEIRDRHEYYLYLTRSSQRDEIIGITVVVQRGLGKAEKCQLIGGELLIENLI